jgi:hypothetical protein
VGATAWTKGLLAVRVPKPDDAFQSRSGTPDQTCSSGRNDAHAPGTLPGYGIKDPSELAYFLLVRGYSQRSGRVSLADYCPRARLLGRLRCVVALKQPKRRAMSRRQTPCFPRLLERRTVRATCIAVGGLRCLRKPNCREFAYTTLGTVPLP